MPAREPQRAVLERPAAPVALAEAGLERGLAHDATGVADRNEVRNSASMDSSSSPASRARRSHCSRSWRSGPSGARAWRDADGHERAHAGPRRDEPLVLELAVGLGDGVRVDRDRADHLAHGRELVALAKGAELEGAADLVDQLQVGATPDFVSR